MRYLLIAIALLCIGCQESKVEQEIIPVMAPGDDGVQHKRFRSSQNVMFEALDLDTDKLVEVTLFRGTEFTVMARPADEEKK